MRVLAMKPSPADAGSGKAMGRAVAVIVLMVAAQDPRLMSEAAVHRGRGSRRWVRCSRPEMGRHLFGPMAQEH